MGHTETFFEIKQGIVKAKQKGGFESIGIDTWGVDFGLLDEHGDLLESAVHYRDDRTLGMQEEVFKVIPKEEVYNLTGISLKTLIPFSSCIHWFRKDRGFWKRQIHFY